jgi:Domain of unknown function (DUF1844)
MSQHGNDDRDKQGSGFKVTDRRIFSDEAAQTEPSAATPESPAAATASVAEAEAPMPPVDFQTFVISLGSSALMHLGAIPHPETGKAEVDLAIAKHSIDVLLMLEKKTVGNLSPNEAGLLGSLLYDLRLKFVEAARK